jgi:uncharacterized protein (DUF885 family)
MLTDITNISVEVSASYTSKAIQTYINRMDKIPSIFAHKIADNRYVLSSGYLMFAAARKAGLTQINVMEI